MTADEDSHSSGPACDGSLNSHNRDPLIGRVINERFKITSLIAKGGMGKVYRAEQASLGRVCALKVLTARAAGEDHAEFERRFFLEASICAKLTHPNTVTIFDYGRTADDVFYMAMEYLEGRTLQRTLKAEGPFDVARTIHVARQICRSLREAHGLGVIHRDLKPANVYLIEHADERDVVKVLDFGLVKSIDPGEAEEVTQAGAFLGSPKYMSPEQIRGDHVDARTDIYALGVMMFEMVTGKVPFDRPNQVNILLAHVHDPVPALHDIRPDVEVDEAFEAIIRRCLSKDPAARYENMDALLMALKQASGRPLSVTGSFEVPQAGPFDPLRATPSVTPQPSTLAVDPTASAAPAEKALEVEPVQPRPARRGLWIAGTVVSAALAVVVALAARSHPSSRGDSGASTAGVTTTAATTSGTTPVTAEATHPIANTKPTRTLTSVTLDSEPAGARVQDDQKVILCDKTPCTLQVDSAGLLVTVSLEGYASEPVRLVASDGPHHVKLVKKAAATVVGRPHPPATNTAATTKPPDNGFKPDPYPY